MSFRGGFRGRGRGFYNQSQSQAQSAASSKKFGASKYTKVPQKSANPLNQYYMERFIKLKRDADMRSLQNISQSYKRVINALSKYPMPIFSAQQAKFLEGVGDVIATKFDEMIEARQKEYEDGVFEIELLRNQQKERDRVKISEDRRSFAGLQISEAELDEISKMSLKEYLAYRDQRNYRIANGLEDLNDPTKKRKFGEISNEEELDDLLGGQKSKKVNTGKSFLDVGSVSWSMLLACYFLSLHDDRKTFYMTMQSVKEMLQVLKLEFKDYVPFETEPKLLDLNAADDLVRFKDNQFIDIIDQTIVKDTAEWRFMMTEKGKKRAKALCKSVGILVGVEIDIENPTTNKITINLYDKDVMPLVDELYNGDNANNISKLKDDMDADESTQAQGGGIFEDFINQIETEIDAILFEGIPPGTDKSKASHLKKEAANQSLMIGGLNQSGMSAGPPLEDEPDEEEDLQETGGQTLAQELMTMMNVSEKENSSSVNIISRSEATGFNRSEGVAAFSIKTEPPKPPPIEDVDCEVILYVDNREKKNQQQGNYIYNKLIDSNVYCEQKALPLGDFIWILRVKQKDFGKLEEAMEDEELQGSAKKGGKKAAVPKKPKKKAVKPREYIDYVLDFIVERKTADDLAASIMDGRYEEQKFRLKNCGINNVIYLIEGKAGQYTKIPTQVLSKAQIHTQIFHGFNVLRLVSIQETLKWLTDMTREIKKKIDLLKVNNPLFSTQIADNLIDFKLFASESGKNSNLTVQQIFARQLRTSKGLGIENVSTITRVFKTPNLLYRCYKKCTEQKQILNILNAGKMELLRNQLIFKHGLNSDQLINTLEEGNPNLPKNIEDADYVNLENVLNASMPKVFNKVLRNLEQETGTKMRKINKKQCEMIYELLCGNDYSKCTSAVAFSSRPDDIEMME